MALSKTTQDHDEIRQWAEKRGAKPAEVSGTHSKNQTGILRFCFPGAPHHNDASLREIPWDEFFEKFDQNNLELIYQDVTAEGAQSNFNKLIYPEHEHAGTSGTPSHSGKSTSSHATGAQSGKSTASFHSKSPGSKSSGSKSGAHSGGTRGSSTSKSSAAGKSSRTSHKAA